VVARHELLADLLGEARGDPFGHLARIREDERRAMFADQRRDAREHILPDLAATDRLERRAGHFEREVEVAAVADVDDIARATRADQQARGGFNRALRRRQADAL
jgi:hypothetical protein